MSEEIAPAEELDTTEQPEGQEPRSINELWDLPYSEMTEAEIEKLVDWKAEIKARDERYRKEQEELARHMEEKAQIHKDAAANSFDLLTRLCASALKEYEDGKTQEN